ncbi:MAG: NifU family protein [Elusimicrobia bacterium]|nr:NifU family protein [Elusimicrobiota bacterium]
MTTATARKEISPQSTMEEVLAAYPSAQRALFTRYHIGGCSDCGFQPTETLEQVLLRKNVLDVEEAIQHIKTSQGVDDRMQITPEELSKNLKQKGVKLIDVRTPREYRLFHIEGALLATEELVKEIMSQWSKDTPIMLYCHLGTRSLDAASYLIGHGFTQVSSLRGGLETWSQKIDPLMPRYAPQEDLQSVSPDSKLGVSVYVHPNNPNTAKFVLSQPLLPKGSAYFQNKESAKGSPLAEKLFQLDQVMTVRLSENTLTLTRTDWENWRPVTEKVSEILRSHILSGQPAVSENVTSSSLSSVELKNKVQEIFDTQINPAVAGHGGNIELLDVKDNNIYIKMGGGCQGCGQANATLRQGIEATLRETFPQINEILDVTDHASGTNPYYK